VGQLFAMRRLLAAPRERAPWFNGPGTGLFVLGMMAAALGVGGWI
jgi:chlorophyll synthase